MTERRVGIARRFSCSDHNLLRSEPRGRLVVVDNCGQLGGYDWRIVEDLTHSITENWRGVFLFDDEIDFLDSDEEAAALASYAMIGTYVRPEKNDA